MRLVTLGFDLYRGDSGFWLLRTRKYTQSEGTEAAMRLQDLIGLAVFEVEEGNEIGKIVDILLDSNWNITGIELESKSFLVAM